MNKIVSVSVSGKTYRSCWVGRPSRKNVTIMWSRDHVIQTSIKRNRLVILAAVPVGPTLGPRSFKSILWTLSSQVHEWLRHDELSWVSACELRHKMLLSWYYPPSSRARLTCPVRIIACVICDCVSPAIVIGAGTRAQDFTQDCNFRSLYKHYTILWINLQKSEVWAGKLTQPH